MHDYNHPPDWDALTDQEKSDWYTQERARRQAMGQRTAFATRARRERRRRQRRTDARGTPTIGTDSE